MPGYLEWSAGNLKLKKLKHIDRNVDLNYIRFVYTCEHPFFFQGVKSLVVWSDPTVMINSPSGSQLKSCTALK